MGNVNMNSGALTDKLWLSPPVAFIVFLALAYGLYRVGGEVAARPEGESSTDKHLPYTGGEHPLPPPGVLAYHAFFRLSLLFGILHVATLVLSTLPHDIRSRRTALLYIAGIAISVFVLTGRED
jgi:NADH:ubiquinone oxidoreductase subunit 3 (subunit A)